MNSGMMRPRLIRGIAVAGLVAFSSAFAADAPPPNVHAMSDIASRQVIVLVDGLRVADRQVEAEDVIAMLTSTRPDATVAETFGWPVAARFSLRDRLPREYRDSLDPRDPEERLQRYILLTYATAKQADTALQGIQRIAGYIWAEKNAIGRWSVSPNDTYYSYQFSPKDFQWGTNNPLNLESAWNSVKGTAYVGHMDNGIQLGHPDLDSATAPWTTPFRAQLSKDFVAGSGYAFYFTNLNGVDEGLFSGTYAGHGTHTAGIIAASPNNTAGIAGVCWNCSLIVTKLVTDKDMFYNALLWAVRAGAQLLNYSAQITDVPTGGCAGTPAHPVCLALEFARGRDVIFVASSGNMHREGIDFPASDSRAVAVGGIQYQGYNAIDTLWLEEQPDANNDMVGSNYGSQQSFVAPARDVLSTVYGSRDWTPFSRCGDSASFETTHGTQSGSVAGSGYGICTGTSMSAPYVTGIAALIRSINPLWTRAQVFEFLRASASRAGAWDMYWGYGVPNAGASVTSALAGTNRLTPLFGLYSQTGGDYMYTTVPQVGISAYRGWLPPRVNDTLIPYTPVGATINEYPSFPILYPNGELPPRAQVWIFTTDMNPLGSQTLAPLYRMSYKCGDVGSTQQCTANPLHVDHTYATSTAEIQSFMSIGYKLDGTEGYIYSNQYAQPAGTVALYRGYSAAVDDWAIFPSSDLVNMNAQGYATSLAWTGVIGYAYLNSGSRPTY